MSASHYRNAARTTGTKHGRSITTTAALDGIELLLAAEKQLMDAYRAEVGAYELNTPS